MYFKKPKLISLAAVIICIIIFSIPVFAADDSDALPAPTTAPEPTTQKSVRYLYPTSVKETQDEGLLRPRIADVWFAKKYG